MADKMNNHDNKDAEESGRPVQLDREQERKPGQQQGGPRDKPTDKPGTEHGRQPQNQ